MEKSLALDQAHATADELAMELEAQMQMHHTLAAQYDGLMAEVVKLRGDTSASALQTTNEEMLHWIDKSEESHQVMWLDGAYRAGGSRTPPGGGQLSAAQGSLTTVSA